MPSVFTILKDELLETTRQSFNRIYPPTGVDSLKRCLTREHPAEPDSPWLAAIIDPFIDDPLTQFTSFLGIPNAQLEPNGRQSIRNLLANLTGWRKNHSLTRNIITSLLLTPLNIAAIPFNFITNCAKVFSEFLPKLFSVFTVQVGIKFIDAAKTRPHDTLLRKLANLGLYAIGALFVVLTYPLSAASIAFGAITSPIETVRSGWVVGKQSYGRKGSLLLGGAALFLVLAMYTIAFPFILKFIGVGLMKIAPKVVLHGINHVAPHFKHIFDVMGKGLAPFAKFLGKFLGHHIGPIVAKMPVLVGISCVAGPITAVSGNLYQPAAKRFQAWFKYKKPVSRVIEHIREKSLAAHSANQQLASTHARLKVSASEMEIARVAPATTTSKTRNCCLFTRTRKSVVSPPSVTPPARKQTMQSIRP